MSTTFIAGFQVGNNRYEQTFNTVNDDTYILSIDNPEPIYRINAGGWVYGKHDVIIGRFRVMDNRCWYYTSKDDSVRLNTKFTSLVEAELDAFKVLLRFGHEE